MKTDDTSLKPPGYWFGVIEYGLREKMRDAFKELDLSRSEWRILHTLADGPRSVDDIEAALPPGERHRRMGARMFGRPGRGFGPGYGGGFGPGNWPGRGYGRWFGRGFAPGFAPGFADAHAEQTANSEHPTPEHPGEHEHEFHGHGHHDYGHHGHGYGHVHPDHEHGDEHAHPDHEHGDEHGHPHHDHAGHHGHAGEAEHGDRSQRRRPRSVAEVLVDFAERGWVVLDDSGATLTDAGRAAHDAAQSRVTELRASVTEGISEADYRTTIATLEQMARNVGWTEGDQPAEPADPEPDPEPEA